MVERLVLVVDDNPGCRGMIVESLRRAGLEPCEVQGAEDALAAADREMPSLAILDIDLGGGESGYAVAHALRLRDPELPIIFVSGVRTESFDRVAGFLLGAGDYLVKPFDPDELVVRVRRLLEARRPALPAPATGAAHDLTRREREVLALLAEGKTQDEIAEILVLSPKTVATHIQHVLAKLEVHSRAEVVAYAHRHGLVQEVAAHLLTVVA